MINFFVVKKSKLSHVSHFSLLTVNVIVFILLGQDGGGFNLISCLMCFIISSCFD